MKNDVFKTVCYGIAVAMGVAVIVTNILGTLSASSAFTMLAIGLLALGLAALKR